MKHLPVAIMSLALAFSASAAGEKAPAKPAENVTNETKTGVGAHQGFWKPIGAVMSGARLPSDALKAITLKIDGDKYEVTVIGEDHADRGTCTLDESTTPKRMTIKGTDGPNRGKTFLAIYEMKDAGSLRVCYDLSGTDFPKEFKAPKGTQHYLVGYRRQKE
jgi:uncharacterized protein (TIGR03067 family)